MIILWLNRMVFCLICNKDDEQKIRQFVNDVKMNKGESFI
jgi:hypothetical protein